MKNTGKSVNDLGSFVGFDFGGGEEFVVTDGLTARDRFMQEYGAWLTLRWVLEDRSNGVNE